MELSGRLGSLTSIISPSVVNTIRTFSVSSMS